MRCFIMIACELDDSKGTKSITILLHYDIIEVNNQPAPLLQTFSAQAVHLKYDKHQ